MSVVLSTVPVDGASLRDLPERGNELVRAITAGMASGDWDQVMTPFEGLLVAIKRLEERLEAVERQTT
ncbi:MAG: hypothetical protein HYW08_17910 [candidate division NC10 bacterium]|nr:hypothetical protein [candidate division NC10 bacterium]